MTRARLGIGATLAVFAAGCGPVNDLSGPKLTASRIQSIIGGTIDNADPEVFGLVATYYSGPNGTGQQIAQGLCTSTLVGSRSLLTASHCVDLGIFNAQSTTQAQSIVLQAANATELFATGGFIAVTEADQNPSWDPNNLTGDVTMCLLAQSPGLTPKAINGQDLSGLAGQPARVIGYGQTNASDQNSVGVKEQVSLPLQNITSDHFDVGNGSTEGICHGDSGGPSLFTFSDGTERVIGVHSYDATSGGQAPCTYGADTRVDFYASWIQSWLAAHDAPQCTKDGFCVQGCSPVDPDCVPVGDACQTASQCDANQCVSDPQHPQTYCSHPCSSGSECPQAMTCTSGVCEFIQLPPVEPYHPCTVGGSFCTNGTVCDGAPGGPTECVLHCNTVNDCPSTAYQCIPGQGTGDFCQKPPVVIAEALEQGPAASSCAAGGAELMLLGAWAALGAFRRGKKKASA